MRAGAERRVDDPGARAPVATKDREENEEDMPRAAPLHEAVLAAADRRVCSAVPSDSAGFVSFACFLVPLTASFPPVQSFRDLCVGDRSLLNVRFASFATFCSTGTG